MNRSYIPAALALIAVLSFVATPHVSAAGNRVAVLRDNIAGLDIATVDNLTAALRKAGFVVTPVSCDDLADAKTLNPQRFDCLVLTYSPRFPGVAAGNLLAFVKGGGNLALLGGPAFREPVSQFGGRWLTAAQFDDSLRALPTENPLFTFDDGDLSAWHRGTNKPEHPSQAVLDTGHPGRCMKLDLRGLGPWQWDTFSTVLQADIPAGQDLLCFWAKAAQQTPQVVVEVDEKDGARWYAPVDLTPEWRRYVLTPRHFKYLADGAPKARGGAADQLNLPNARQISFGLATGLSNHPDGDHVIWIDEVGTAHADLPPGVIGGPAVALDVFGDYEPYQLHDIHQATACPDQDILAKTQPITGDFAGVSAIGYAFALKSRFIPLLSADDKYGRHRGWAAGLVVNYAGPYKGSNWLLCGLESPAFYRSAAFAQGLVQALTAMRDRDLPTLAAQANAAAQATVLPLTAPAPAGFVRLSADKRHFLTPDGKPLFLIGANYLGPSDRFCQLGGGYWDPNLLEADFKRAHDAGINCFRLWVAYRETDPARRDAIKQVARKYGIYLVLHVGDSQAKLEDTQTVLRGIAENWKDEPMVLGYDLFNEPYVATAAAPTLAGEKSPLLKLRPYERYADQIDKAWVDRAVKERPPWPQVPGWLKDEDDARQLYAAYSLYGKYTDPFTKAGADYSTFPALPGLLPLDGPFADYAQALNATFERWLGAQVEALRAVDSHHFIGVGYNTILTALPANHLLDFVSEHVYQSPTSYAEVTKNATALDRLAKLWPNQPTTLGEFGYSNGIRLPGGMLDLHTSAVGEMMHYLEALAHGHSGCTKWVLTDWPTPMQRDNCPWTGQGSIYEDRFGLYYYDGTPPGGPKPIVPALRFLSEYVAGGGSGGTMTISPGKTSIGAVYAYEAPRALFIGDISYRSPRLEFDTLDGKPTNLMLTWDDKGLRLMSTCDARVRLQPSAFVPGLSPFGPKVTGKTASVRQEGKWLVLEMLEGETVTLGRG